MGSRCLFVPQLRGLYQLPTRIEAVLILSGQEVEHDENGEAAQNADDQRDNVEPSVSVVVVVVVSVSRGKLGKERPDCADQPQNANCKRKVRGLAVVC